MNRRHLLKTLGALPLLAALPAYAADRRRLLVLVELAGGNDGLNTVIPFADAAYSRLRPGLAIERDQVLGLDERTGLHPALAPLMKAWQAKELAVVQGVGYPRPNRSHFRSIEIWHAGTEERAKGGWLADVLKPGVHAVDGVALDGEAGPLAGTKSLVMKRPERFLRSARRLESTPAEADGALRHILQTRAEVRRAADVLAPHLRGRTDFGGFPKSPLGRQLAVAARLAISAAPVAVIKVKHGGFDTHANQPNRHRRLLQQLAQGLAALRRALSDAGVWRDTLVMTYAEFGRRPKQNASRGTDHGTAAPHFLMGGRVKGGLYGAQPSLIDLEGEDLRHAVDFREMYATARAFWGVPPGTHRPLACLRG